MIYQLRNEKDLGQNPVGRIEVAAEFESLSRQRGEFVRRWLLREIPRGSSAKRQDCQFGSGRRNSQIVRR